jgi:hypothetical protein
MIRPLVLYDGRENLCFAATFDQLAPLTSFYRLFSNLVAAASLSLDALSQVGATQPV